MKFVPRRGPISGALVHGHSNNTERRVVPLKMETVRSSETLVSTYKFTRRYYPEDQYSPSIEPQISSYIKIVILEDPYQQNE
jgi:hypothetical protein